MQHNVAQQIICLTKPDTIGYKYTQPYYVRSYQIPNMLNLNNKNLQVCTNKDLTQNQQRRDTNT